VLPTGFLSTVRAFPLVAIAARALEVVIVICSTVRFSNDVIGAGGWCTPAGALNACLGNHAERVTPNNHLAVQFPLPAVST